MQINLNRLTKKEILWLHNHKCKHSHRYVEIVHPNCLAKDINSPVNERVGFWDIETAGSLDADWGVMLCYCIKYLNGPLISRKIAPNDILNNKVRDKHLVEQLCTDLAGLDKIVVYYGKDSKYRHDLPFSRTRAVKWGVSGFPLWKEKKVQDVYDIIKYKFKLSRSRMFDACRTFGVECKASPFNPDIWLDCIQGKPKALNYAVRHCQEDVKALEELWKKVIVYKETQTTT